MLRGREAEVGGEEGRLVVRGVRLVLGVLLVLLILLMLVVLGVGDAETVAGAAEGLVLAMPGTETAMNLVGGIIEHVYPANGDVAGGSTLDPSLSPDGKRSSVTARGRGGGSEAGVVRGASRRSVEGSTLRSRGSESRIGRRECETAGWKLPS